jgi:glycine/D-amino acid oxidase-like deaminating enzyme
MSVSHWAFSGASTLHCDLAIVGAGVAGISAALHAQRMGLRVVVLEAGHAGHGASTRNAGFLMRGCADNYAQAAATFGRERARALWQLTEDNLLGLAREGVLGLPGSRRVPSVLVALDDAELQHLRASERMLREDGFDVGWWDAAPSDRDTLWRSGAALGGLVNPHDAACHSREVIEHLLSRLAPPPVGQVVLHDEVAAIEAEGSSLVVRSRRHAVRAAQVLVCTNAYGPRLLPGLAGEMEPNRGQMLACRPEGVSLAASYYLNFGHEYIRQAADGTILVGGCRGMFAEAERTTLEEPTAQVQQALEAFARRVLGLARDVDLRVSSRWAGLMGFTPRGLPIIRRVGATGSPEAPVWFCGGFNGHGMSMAYATTRAALAMMLEGAADPFAA